MKLGGWLLIASCFVEIVGVVVLLNGDGWVLVAIGVIFFIGSIVVTNMQNNQEKINDLAAIKDKLSEVSHFSPTHQLFSHDNKILVSVDNETEQLIYTTKFINTLIRFKDIIESEIIIDDATVSKVSRTGQVAGAIVGGVIAGGVGAIIGGLSSSSKSVKKLKKITLKIVYNDMTNPIINLVLLDSSEPLKLDNYNVKVALENAQKWEGLFKVIVKTSNDINDENTIPLPHSESLIADQLYKLAELFKDGLITETEFKESKQKLFR